MRSVVDSRAERLRKQADFILRKSSLLEFLADYGEVNVTGSYALNLMTTGDIDIHVVNPTIRKAAVKRVLDALIEQNFFDGYHFHDWVSHFETARNVFGIDPLKGYYIALRTVFRGTRWKIDIWFLTSHDAKGARLMKSLQRNVTADVRHIILKLKRMRDEKAREFKISSAVIYEAVINREIRTFPALLKFAH